MIFLMLLVEANRQCLQKLLRNYPEVCSALHLTDPYWEENVMVLRSPDFQVSKILSKYFNEESIQKKLLIAIPVEKFIIETITTSHDPESMWSQIIFEEEQDYEKYFSASPTKNIILGIESALYVEPEFSDMTSAMLEAAVEVFASTESRIIKDPTLEDLVEYLSQMFNCSPEVARNNLFQIKMSKPLVTQMVAAFMQTRLETISSRRTEAANKNPESIGDDNGSVVSMASPETEEDSSKADSVPGNNNQAAIAVVPRTKRKYTLRNPKPQKESSPKPAEILNKEGLPSRYKVFDNTTPPKPTTRRTEKTTESDNTNNIAYLKACVERMSSSKAGQFYVLQALMQGSNAAQSIYYPSIIKAYAIYEKPEQAEERINRVKEAASVLLSKMKDPSSQENNSQEDGEGKG